MQLQHPGYGAGGQLLLHFLIQQAAGFLPVGNIAVMKSSPCALITGSPDSLLISILISCAPSSEVQLTTAAPIPEATPVITMFFPVKFVIIILNWFAI